MSFILRSVHGDDLGQLVDLARQFTLLNLPGDKKVLAKKIERSMASFSGGLPKNEAEYVFVLEDTEEQQIVGSSLILPKHGTDDVPHTFFKVLKKNHYSEDLGIGFIHQVLRFQMDTDGPTEIGGLLVNKSYRGRPEKLGRQISFVRFNYIGMYPERFEERLLCELTPPLTDEGRSEFWEALGRRFTGLPYQEADLLSQSHKEFIQSLFPEEDIYLCLLDTKARTVVGRVGDSTKPAQHLLESIGFHYLEEVDPFDGGPHYGARVQDLLPIKHGLKARVSEWKDSNFKDLGLVGIDDDHYRCLQTPYELRGDEICLPLNTKRILGLEDDQLIYLTPSHSTPHKRRDQGGGAV